MSSCPNVLLNYRTLYILMPIHVLEVIQVHVFRKIVYKYSSNDFLLTQHTFLDQELKRRLSAKLETAASVDSRSVHRNEPYS